MEERDLFIEELPFFVGVIVEQGRRNPDLAFVLKTQYLRLDLGRISALFNYYTAYIEIQYNDE